MADATARKTTAAEVMSALKPLDERWIKWGAELAKKPGPVEKHIERVPPIEHDEDDYSGEREWCDTCGNLGTLPCLCGGDLCVCLNYGEIPCPDCGY